MARPLRLEFSGALYHVTSRGDRREAIYEEDADRLAFLAVLDEVCANSMASTRNVSIARTDTSAMYSRAVTGRYWSRSKVTSWLF
jgi:hypothetical protein